MKTPDISETPLVRRCGVRGAKLFARLWFPLLYAFLVVGCVAVGCQHTPSATMDSPLTSNLSPNEVVKMAKDLAIEREIDLQKYEVQLVNLRLRDGELVWVLFFGRNAHDQWRPVGDHFTIEVDDATKSMRFIPGR